jgi:hypothetical protein
LTAEAALFVWFHAAADAAFELGAQPDWNELHNIDSLGAWSEPSERHSAHQKPGAIPSRSRAFESMPVHRSTIPEAGTLKGGSVALQQKQIEFTECMYVYLAIKIVAESISIAGVPAAVAACD